MQSGLDNIAILRPTFNDGIFAPENCVEMYIHDALRYGVKLPESFIPGYRLVEHQDHFTATPIQGAEIQSQRRGPPANTHRGTSSYASQAGPSGSGSSAYPGSNSLDRSRQYIAVRSSATYPAGRPPLIPRNQLYPDEATVIVKKQDRRLPLYTMAVRFGADVRSIDQNAIYRLSLDTGSYTTWVYGDGCERYIDLHGRTLESTPWTDNPEQEAYMGGKAMLPYRTQDVIRGSSNTMLTYADGSTVVASLVQRAIKIESWANTLGLRARDIVISSFYVGVAQAVNQAVITSDDDGILALGPIPPDNFELPVNQFASRLHRRSGNSNIVEQIRSLPQALSHYRITQGRSFLMRLLCPGETSHTFDDGKLSFIKFGSEWPFDVSEIDPRGSLRYMYISQIRVPLVPSFSQWKVSLLAIQFANKYNQFTERIYMDPNENPTPEPQEALIDCGATHNLFPPEVLQRIYAKLEPEPPVVQFGNRLPSRWIEYPASTTFIFTDTLQGQERFVTVASERFLKYPITRRNNGRYKDTLYTLPERGIILGVPFFYAMHLGFHNNVGENYISMAPQLRVSRLPSQI